MKPTYPNGLRLAMKRAGKGPSELADALETNRQTVQRWAAGERKLTVLWALKLAPLLGTMAEELLLTQREASVVRIPLVDWVSAGRLAEPKSQISVEDVPLLAFADLGRGEFFALKVVGNSMDRISPEGSVIVVDRAEREPLVSGKPYIFALKGETTYKFWQGGDPPYLEPYSTDPTNKPIFVKKKRDFEVIGRVRRSVLDL